MAESQYRFADAANDFRTYLTLPASTRPDATVAALHDIRKKTLRLSWLAGKSKDLIALTHDTAICGGTSNDLVADCERAEVLALWLEGAIPAAEQNPEALKLWLERARNGIETNRALWAAATLSRAEQMNFRDRLSMVRAVAQSWPLLAPMDAFVVLPVIHQSVIRALELDRLALEQHAPLRADAKFITRRIEAMREIENAATAAAKLPWASLRARALDQVARLYLDLSGGLKKLPEPKNLSTQDREAYLDTVAKLVIPFEEKGQEIRRAAFELASRAKIETAGFEVISRAFFADNPSQAAKLKNQRQPASVTPPVFELPLLMHLDPAAEWQISRRQAANPVATRWLQAALDRRWPQVAYFLAEAQSQAQLQNTPTLTLMKGMSLELVGAHAEASLEVEAAQKQMTHPQARAFALVLLREGASAAFQIQEAATWQLELTALLKSKK